MIKYSMTLIKTTGLKQLKRKNLVLYVVGSEWLLLP